MRRMLWVVTVISTLFLADAAAMARTVTVDVTRTDVQSYSPESENLGNYYTFRFAIPARLANETFMDAYLELYVDAASDVDELAGGGAVTLEVFPLKSDLTGDLDASDLREASMKRTVRTGEAQRVNINISEFVRYSLAHGAENHGLAVGSLTGQRLGRFSVRNGDLGEGVVARVTIIFQELGGPEASALQ